MFYSAAQAVRKRGNQGSVSVSIQQAIYKTSFEIKIFIYLHKIKKEEENSSCEENGEIHLRCFATVFAPGSPLEQLIPFEAESESGHLLSRMQWRQREDYLTPAGFSRRPTVCRHQDPSPKCRSESGCISISTFWQFSSINHLLLSVAHPQLGVVIIQSHNIKCPICGNVVAENEQLLISNTDIQHTPFHILAWH